MNTNQHYSMYLAGAYELRRVRYCEGAGVYICGMHIGGQRMEAYYESCLLRRMQVEFGYDHK